MEIGAGRAVRVLLVADDHTGRASLVLTLSGAGFTVVTSARGDAAHTFARRWLPDVIVVDVSRPSAGGEAFLRHAHEAGGLGPPVIALAPAASGARAMTGATDVLAAPLDAVEFLTLVHRHGRRGAALPDSGPKTEMEDGHGAAARRDRERAEAIAAADRDAEADAVTRDSMDSLIASDPPSWISRHS
jgi:DNA-binding response OmpR family regulator